MQVLSDLLWPEGPRRVAVEGAVGDVGGGGGVHQIQDGRPSVHRYVVTKYAPCSIIAHLHNYAHNA